MISSKAKQLIGTLKMNRNVRSLAFADGGNQLLSSGGDGHVYHRDLRTRKCMHKAIDKGSLTGLHLTGRLLFRHRLQQQHRERVQQGRVPRREEEAAEGDREPHDRDRSDEVQPQRPGSGDKLGEGAEQNEARARPVSHRVPELARASVQPPVPLVPAGSSLSDTPAEKCCCTSCTTIRTPRTTRLESSVLTLYFSAS